MQLSRRNLLTGRAVDAPPPLRPPGAIARSLFEDRCTACGECASACPERIIVRGAGGYPEIDFARGACTACGDCARACDERALLDTSPVVIQLGLSIGNDCLARNSVVCRSCGDECESQAISFPPRLGGVALPVVNQDDCWGCGACIGICPQQAIRGIPHE